MVKMLTFLVNTTSNLQVFLLKKIIALNLQMQKLLTFLSKNITVYAIFNDQSFNDTLPNDIVSFEQLGPGVHCNRSCLMNDAAISFKTPMCSVFHNTR